MLGAATHHEHIRTLHGKVWQIAKQPRKRIWSLHQYGNCLKKLGNSECSHCSNCIYAIRLQTIILYSPFTPFQHQRDRHISESDSQTAVVDNNKIIIKSNQVGLVPPNGQINSDGSDSQNDKSKYHQHCFVLQHPTTHLKHHLLFKPHKMLHFHRHVPQSRDIQWPTWSPVDRTMVHPGPEAWTQLRAPHKNRNFSL